MPDPLAGAPSAALSEDQVSAWARTLDDAMRERREVVRITATLPALALADGYRIQDAGLALRAARGERVVGLKMGLTSRAKMKQMGVDAPIYGVLTDAMRVEDGARFDLAASIHAKIEPEVAFLVGRELGGGASFDDVLDACDGVSAAMEIIDSRYRNFEFRLPDVVADDCSSSAFVLGPAVRPARAVDVADLRMELEVDGAVAEAGSSREIYGHPVESVVELCRMLGARGRTLPAGSVVLAGAATAAIPLAPGHTYRVVVHGLGAATVRT